MATPQKIYRFKHGKGYIYKTKAGDRLTDPEVIEFARKLVIPPAWQNVEITVSERSKILATGYDAAGRKQYIYNPRFRERQEKVKFDRLLSFAEALPRMRRVTGQHLRRRKLDRDKVMACMVRLIDQAYFRVGNERYAKDNQTYGLTTMRSRHLTIEGDRMIFRYIGKSHKENHREVEDPHLVKLVKELDELPGYEIFKYFDDSNNLVDVKSEDLNAYIKEIMGSEFSAKDFRTWAGTLIAAVALAETQGDRPPSKREVTSAIKHVAERLGNTPAIAKASYIDPRVINHYLDGRTIKNYLELIEDQLEESELSGEERALMSLLQERLRRRRQAKK